MSLGSGCIFVVRKYHKGKVEMKEFCHKMEDRDSTYCPKHKLFIEDAKVDRKRDREEESFIKQVRINNNVRVENTLDPVGRRGK